MAIQIKERLDPERHFEVLADKVPEREQFKAGVIGKHPDHGIWVFIPVPGILYGVEIMQEVAIKLHELSEEVNCGKKDNPSDNE